MAAIVTQNWTGRTLTRKSWNWVAHESWVVTGVSDPDSALDAVGLGAGSTYPENDNMLLSRYYAEANKGSQSWTVHAEYAFGDQGQFQDSPLNEDTKYIPEPERDTIPVDSDINYMPLLQSAGDFIDPPLTRPIPYLAMRFQKYLPYYNLSIPFQFQDTTNSGAISVTLIGSVDVGQAYCDYVKPVDPYTLHAPYVNVEYRLKFKPGKTPWQPRFKDQGRTGWYSDPASGKTLQGPIVDDSGVPVPFSVLLNGKGKPLLAGVRSGTSITTQGFWVLGTDRLTLYSPVNNPNPPSNLMQDTVLSNANQTIMIANNIPTADFTAMGL